LGLSPIITTASLKHEEFLKSLGATHVVDRNTPTASLQEEIKKIASAPIKHVFDTISSQETQQFGHDLVVPGGQLAIVTQLKISMAADKTMLFAFGSRGVPENRELLKIMFSELTRLLEDDVIVPNRYEVLPGGLGGIEEGLQRLKNDQVSGKKLVARVNSA